MAEDTQLTGTPEHQKRLQDAKAHREKVLKSKKDGAVLEQWVEVHKRVHNEVGKVLLKTKTDSGLTHSWYVGRENKSIPWLKEQKKAGLTIFMGPRKDEDGRPGIPYVFPKGA